MAVLKSYHRDRNPGNPVAERRDRAPALNRSPNMRYYFHVQDGEALLDGEGMELSSTEAIREEAIQSSGELLKGANGPNFWSGEPWRLWVTDQPNGEGNTVLTLTFSAHLPAYDVRK